MSLLNTRVRNVATIAATVASLSLAAQAQKAISTLAPGVSSSSTALRPVLSQHVPKLVTSGSARRVDALAASEQLQLVLSLPLRNQDALNALLADLYNPASPKYRQWLQPADFDAQFGPTAADYQAVVSWARANGFDIVAKASNNRVLTIQGSTGLVNRAFHVTETTFHDDIRNRDFRAPDREPTTDLSVPLLAISGLETSNPRTNFHEKAPAATEKLPASISLRAPEPTPRATGSGPSGSFLPSDMRAAYYGVTGTGALTGAGQSVAIYSYDSYLASDVAQWYSTTGVTPSTVPVTNKVITGFSGGSCPGTSCDDGEQVLDILQVQGMAPGLSHIYFYESDSAVSEVNQMASDDLAAVITSSWSGGDFGPACDPAFLQMAAQGQTYLNATGDSGGYNPFTYLPPGLDPYIVEVGGTDLTTASAGGAWSAETAWADSGGGFFDPNILIPTWQQASGIITSTNKGSTAYRNSPDIAAEANFDNTLVSNGSFETGYGGTSYATPRMAGYLALANQQSVAAGTGTLGFINPTLYELGLRSTAASTYHDTTSGSAPSSTSYNGAKTTYSAVAGYDLVTGWGSPNGPGLLNALTGPNFSLAAGTSALTIARSATATVNFTITPVNNFTGTPTFSVSGLPTGVSGTVSTTGTNSYSLPLTVSSTATVGTANITVTATYGSIVKTTTFALTVGKRAGYDFTISATNAMVTQMSFANSIVTVQDGAGYDGPVDLSVSNLPAGITVQFGTPSTFSKSNLTFFASIASAPGTYTVLLTGSAAGVVVHSIPVTLTILPVSSALVDGGFEGATNPWVFTSSLGGGYLCSSTCGYYQHSGTYFAYLSGFGETDTDVLSQTFSIPVVNKATLNFWLYISTAETTTTAKNDNLTVTVTNAAGTSTTIATFSNLNHTNGYALYSYDLSSFIGQTVTLKFTGVENASRATAFLFDDISVVTQ